MAKILAIAFALACAALFVQARNYKASEAKCAAAEVQVAALKQAQADAAATIAALRQAALNDADLLQQTLRTQDSLTQAAAVLDYQLKEALKNDGAPLSLADTLPRAAADALCLQYHEAAGHYLAPDHKVDPTARAHAGKADPPAPDCSRWRRMTVQDAVEWVGLLLRHAGLERTDKAALRTWAKDAAPQTASEVAHGQ